jgi:ABC-type nitrate/sulfonate/bicarbonate transport system substrate-binding protein
LPEVATVRIALATGQPSDFAPLLADLAGSYAQFGISMAATKFNAEGDAVAAMASGQADVASVGAVGSILSQLTATPASQLTVHQLKATSSLYCERTIRTAKDVKGKSIAISIIGSTTHASALLALQALGLTTKDVALTPIGGNAVRIAALKGGSVSCAVVANDSAGDLASLGFTLLIDLSSRADLGYPAGGLAARRDWLARYPNTALAVVAANLAAQNLFWVNPDQAATYWATFAQIDLAIARTQIASVQGYGNRSLRWTPASFQFVQSVVAYTDPAITSVDVGRAMDLSYLQQLEAIGFYQRLGIPVA